MIKLGQKKVQRLEEEKKNQEAGGSDEQKKGVKKSSAELRVQKEIAELDIPSFAKATFSEDNILHFNLVVDLKDVVCIWRGGKYEFTIDISPMYPHEAPKCKCLT